MNLDELYAAADAFCEEHWGCKYTGKIKLVNRMWSCKNAHFETMKSDPSHQMIVFSKKKNLLRSKEDILGTLLHELVHWRLHNLGLPNRDIDPEFIEECINVCAPFSQAKSAQEALKKFLRPKQTTIDDYLEREQRGSY